MPTSADLNALWVACGNTGSWKGADFKGKIALSKTVDNDHKDSKEYEFTFKGKAITLAPSAAFSSKKT